MFGRKAHKRQKLCNPVLTFFTLGIIAGIERLPKDRFDPHARIERGKRVLENDLHALAVGPHVTLGERKNIDTVKHSPATCRLDQPQQGAACRRLARSRFTDQSDRRAALDRKADIFDGMDGPAAPARKTFDQSFYSQQRRHRFHCNAHISELLRQRDSRPEPALSSWGGMVVHAEIA